MRRTEKRDRATARGTILGAPRATRGASPLSPFPRPPSYNEADVSDKPADIRNLTPITAPQEAALDARYRARLETLLAVDEMVGNLIGALKDKGELDDTVFIFTADNGFFHGEHRVRNGKVRHYEESSKVPLIIRGAGRAEGQAARPSSRSTPTWRRRSSTTPTPSPAARWTAAPWSR